MSFAGLRTEIENDLADTLEGEFSTAVTVINPAGTKKTVYGSVLYDYVRATPEGSPVVVHEPCVILRRSTLMSAFGALPVEGQNWVMQFPTDPTSVVNVDFALKRPAEGGRSIGYLRYYPTKLIQTTGGI